MTRKAGMVAWKIHSRARRSELPVAEISSHLFPSKTRNRLYTTEFDCEGFSTQLKFANAFNFIQGLIGEDPERE
mgnify:CR=1 FL=1